MRLPVRLAGRIGLPEPSHVTCIWPRNREQDLSLRRLEIDAQRGRAVGDAIIQVTHPGSRHIELLFDLETVC